MICILLMCVFCSVMICYVVLLLCLDVLFRHGLCNVLVLLCFVVASWCAVSVSLYCVVVQCFVIVYCIAVVYYYVMVYCI